MENNLNETLNGAENFDAENLTPDNIEIHVDAENAQVDAVEGDYDANQIQILE